MVFLEALTYTRNNENIQLLIVFGTLATTDDILRNCIFVNLSKSEYAVRQLIRHMIDQNLKYEELYKTGWKSFPSIIEKGNYVFPAIDPVQRFGIPSFFYTKYTNNDERAQ